MILDALTCLRGTLRDANGASISPYCVWADTETGESVHVALDADGGFDFTTDDAGQVTVRKEWLEHPAPLKWIPE
jgi:hypothetical protein